jgi:hypothetical protein
VVLSIPRWGSLGVLEIRAASAAGGVFTGGGVGTGAEPAGVFGFTASSRFHIGHSPRVLKS